MYSEISGAYPRMPSPTEEPRDKLSSQLVFDCASLRTMGWPSCRTLWTVMSALNVCTSSARIGCLEHAISIGRSLGTMDAPWLTYTFMPCQKEAELL